MLPRTLATILLSASLVSIFRIWYLTNKLIPLKESGATVTFLLRSLKVFDEDATIQKYVASGHARLVKGDGLVPEEVRHGWEEATKDGPVDFVLFTVGEPKPLSLPRIPLSTTI